MNFGFLFKGMSSTVKLGKKCIKGIGYFLEDKFYIKVLLVFVFFVSVFSLVYMSLPTVSSGDDHFFHIRFAEAIRQNGFFESFQNFKSIYFSKHAQGNEYFIYYNFLFYLVLIPFTYLKPLFLGIKLYSVFSASLSFTLLYFCFSRFSIKYPFVWTILSIGIFGSYTIYRFFLSRPFTLAPILLVFFVFLLSRKNYFYIFLFSFLYLFWHSATFYFPIGISLVFFIFEQIYFKKSDYRLIINTIGGVILGIVFIYMIPSDFFHLLYDIFFKIFQETVLGNHVNINEGIEVYKKDFFTFVKDNNIAFGLFIVSIFVFLTKYVLVRENKKVSNLNMYIDNSDMVTESVLFFFSVSFFSFSFWVSGRFQDFFVFFSIAFIAVSLDIFFVRLKVGDIFQKATLCGLTVLSVFYFVTTSLYLHDNFSDRTDPLKFANIGSWISENVNPEDVVFFPNWGWFPQLYYYAPHNRYVIGIEPRFLYDFDPKLYWKWFNISNNGLVCDKELCDSKLEEGTRIIDNSARLLNEGNRVADVLVNDFKTSTIVISSQYNNFKKILDSSSRFNLVFEDKNGFFVYKIK